MDGKFPYKNIVLYASIGVGLYFLLQKKEASKKSIPSGTGYSPTDFIKKYYPFALASQKATGVPWAVTLAQAGVESAWGKSAPGNNFFGIKASRGSWSGATQKSLTWEYGKTGDRVMDGIKDEIISITPPKPPDKLYKYRVLGSFRKYDSPEQSFIDHGTFLKTNQRYRNAFLTNDPRMFLNAIAKAGYATDPLYAKKVGVIIDNIFKVLKKG